MERLQSQQFYRLWVRRTLTPAVGIAGAVGLFVGVAAAFAQSRWPSVSALGTSLDWILPSAAFVVVLSYHALRAPFDIAKEIDDRRQAAEDQLTEKRDCQRIADELTREFHYGVHQLLNRPPSTSDEGREWQRVAHNWTQGVLHRMREFGCTPQELNHVETIALTELAGVPEIPFAIDLAMHQIRLGRVADISTKYAERSEELATRFK